MVAASAGSPLSAQAETPVGPPYDYTKELMHSNVLPLKNMAAITRAEHGYLYRSGIQNSRIVIRPVPGGLRFAEPTATRFKKLAPPCRRVPARVGIAAVCRVPRTVSVGQPLLVQVWPRLGDDTVNASRVPETIAMTVLGDRGNDVARLGAGSDFFNGAFGNDRVSGGAGHDWLRSGDDRDQIWGGAGDDLLGGVDGPDTIYAGPGDDRAYGGEGDDVLYAGEDKDFVVCGGGWDSAFIDDADDTRFCESVG